MFYFKKILTVYIGLAVRHEINKCNRVFSLPSMSFLELLGAAYGQSQDTPGYQQITEL